MAYVAVGDAEALRELAGAQRPGCHVFLVGVPELDDPLGGGRRAGAQLGEQVADLSLVAAQLPGELGGVQPLTAADLSDPVVAFHLGGQPLRISGAASDRRLLVATSGKMGLQPGELAGRGAAVADRLAQDL